MRGGCPGNCTGHGACFNGTCHCDAGFTRDDCSLVTQTCDKNCSGHGACTDGACACHAGYAGAACDAVAGGVCPNNCTGHGSCDEASRACVCEPGHGGADCGRAVSPCPKNCSMRGNCEDGRCKCLGGYSGRDCSVTCPQRCSTPNGVCVAGRCSCLPGYKGDGCATRDKMAQVTAARTASGARPLSLARARHSHRLPSTHACMHRL